MQLEGKRVLVTGGSAGIGRAVAADLRQIGAQVMICSRSEGPLAATASELGVEAAVCDVADAAQCERLVERVREVWGGVDILINNAGVQRNPDFTSTVDFAELEQEIRINLVGPIRLVQLLLPLLRASSEPAIVNVTTGLALLPKRSAPVYCATKAGLHSFSISLRWQLEATNVRVMEVLPPLVNTAMAAGRGENEIGPEVVSAALVAGLKRNAKEVLVGKARLLAWMLFFAPWLAERVMKRK